MADKVVFVGPLDRVLFLRSLPALDGLAPAHLAAIAQHARERFFPRGAVLFRREQPAEAVYLVVEGKVAVTRVGRSQHLGPGEAVGFLDLLARAEHGVEARALVDTLTLELDWDAQLDVCEEHFPVLMQYVRYLAQLAIRELLQLSAEAPEVSPADLPVRGTGPLNFVERILVLSRSRAFSTSSLDALTELARHVTEVHLDAQQTVWQREEPADHFLLIASGIVRGDLPEGRALRARAASTLGMHEALRGESRWYSAAPETSAVALRIEVEPFVDILEDHFDLAVDFTSVLANRVIELLQREPGSEVSVM